MLNRVERINLIGLSRSEAAAVSDAVNEAKSSMRTAQLKYAKQDKKASSEALNETAQILRSLRRSLLESVETHSGLALQKYAFYTAVRLEAVSKLITTGKKPDPRRKAPHEAYILAHEEGLSLEQASLKLGVTHRVVLKNWSWLGLKPHGVRLKVPYKEYLKAHEDGLTLKQTAFRLKVAPQYVGYVWRKHNLNPNPNPPTVRHEEYERAREEGLTAREAANKLGVTARNVHKHWKRQYKETNIQETEKA
ncbi:MAG: hypothetical protein KGH64_00355 [Candidatus Micrarchaeota archaeon]|nr:hypothetical protein [Candidatus Micrarchaeota archaeon]MDE1859207.1 hypothetical protein [Candidatus Micrarchaeota archaeon]